MIVIDANILALSAGDNAFATFDKALGKVATQSGFTPQVRVLGRWLVRAKQSFVRFSIGSQNKPTQVHFIYIFRPIDREVARG